MIASPVPAWALTAVFVLSGGYALLRCSATVAGPLPPERRTAELAHLVMSVSMVLMIWSRLGAAALAGLVVLFVVFTGYFTMRAVRGWRSATHGCAGGAAHALMAAAMVWMLLSMPLLMPMSTATGMSGTGHAGHGSMSGDAAGGAAAVTLAVGVALVVACGYWTLRALRRDPAPDPVRAPALVGGPAGPAPPAQVRPVPRVLADRTDAGCHAVTSLGMVVMLLAVVLGG